MTLYQHYPHSAYWPEPIEHFYQGSGGQHAGEALAPKAPHLSVSDIMFMTGVMSSTMRPWGIVTWMAEMYGISRQTVYDLTKRMLQRLSPPAGAVPAPQPDEERRIRRTALTAAFPGKVAIRPMQEMLQEAFGASRSVGWISELLTDAGERADRVLADVPLARLGPVIVVRDEKFFQNKPILMVIEPVSAVILGIWALPDRQAETWALALTELTDRGLQIAGVVEDMARMYDKSQDLAELDLPSQKDVWHLLRDAGQLLKDLERRAYRAMKRSYELEKKLQKAWGDECFNKYIAAQAKEDRLCSIHQQLSEWLPHLADAFELVDERSGEIRDRKINGWLLNEVIQALLAIDHPAVQTFARRLRRHQDALLTFLDWLSLTLEPFHEQLAQLLPSLADRKRFTRLAARQWRLQQSLTNGHAHVRAWLNTLSQELDAWFSFYPQLRPQAQHLSQALNAAIRSSAMIENINGLLAQFLVNRRSFRNEITRQNYLNLFALWHNMRPFARGKRQGQSPYQHAGIELASDDWLTLLGYPAAI